jgi:hypothetical protein
MVVQSYPSVQVITCIHTCDSCPDYCLLFVHVRVYLFSYVRVTHLYFTHSENHCREQPSNRTSKYV